LRQQRGKQKVTRTRKQTVLAAIGLVLASATELSAQNQPQGIRLAAPYSVQRPLVAVRPFTGPEPIAAAIDSVSAIVQRDLTFNNRFRMLQALPQELHTGEIDYAKWNALNVVYVVSGELTPTARGYELAIAVHDVVYRRVQNQQRYAVPAADDADFRMAAHAVSDEVVRWLTQTPGVAATRIAVTRQNGRGSYDLMLVDSDGFGLRRIVGFGGQLYSPSWSPDGRRLLYAVNGDAGWQLIERDVTSGSQRTISPGGDMILTPSYSRDGTKVLLGVWRENRSELVEYDLARQCCPRRISGQGDDLEAYPAPSPDGQRLLFVSDRLQDGRPHIFVMPLAGGDASLLTPYERAQRNYYTSPAWSPNSSRVAFHGHWNARGSYQIMLADADRPGGQVEQLTSRGNNEDPSWAPDGRHLVYTASGDGPAGLYIIDVESHERRALAEGGNLRMADWSPRLLRAADILVRSSPPNEER
jgi:TolB protein